MPNPTDIKKNMINLEVQVLLYLELKELVDKIGNDFEENLSKKCKFQKVWKDPYDGELIPRCLKVHKGRKLADRMECTLDNCPYNPDCWYGTKGEHFRK